jgi:hypothetical protein
MIDSTSAPQVVQQVHPSWFDWITVAAIIVGPILALLTQRALDWIREKKNRRVNLYLTAMSLRATWLNPDSLRALNSLDTVFNKSSDKPIRDAWARVIAHAYTPQPDSVTNPDGFRHWNNRMLDLRVDLYQLLGEAVVYKKTVEYIKTHFYSPQYHIDAEQEGIAIRKQFTKALTDDGLKVVLVQPQEPRGG